MGQMFQERNSLHLILILYLGLPFPQSDSVCTLVRLSRSPPPWRCSAATAPWCPTATAPVTIRSQTTSSSACLVFGRTPGPARPFSSKPWTRGCWKSGTCAIEATRPLLWHQGSKAMLTVGRHQSLELVAMRPFCVCFFSACAIVQKVQSLNFRIVGVSINVQMKCEWKKCTLPRVSLDTRVPTRDRWTSRQKWSWSAAFRNLKPCPLCSTHVSGKPLH